MPHIRNHNFLANFIFLVSPGCAGADVAATEAGSRKREAASGVGALQEVFDAATDTLAEKQPLQGLPTQVTQTC